MTVNFGGNVYDDAGNAVSGASVKLLETGTTTQEGSTVTTDSDGRWDFLEADQDRYDVEITKGSSVRRIKWSDEISLQELDVRNNTGAAYPAATFTNLTNSAANQVAVFSGANSTKADNDEIYLSFKLADSAGNLDEFARMTVVATDVTSGTEDGQIEFDVIKAGTLTNVWTLTSSSGAAMSFDMNVDSLTFGAGADTDITLTFDANSADGVITWMEDEDYFKFSDDILMNSTEKIQFYDTAIYIYSSADGQLDLVADTEIQIAATTVDINGAVAFNGALTGITNITLTGTLSDGNYTFDTSGNVSGLGTVASAAITSSGIIKTDDTTEATSTTDGSLQTDGGLSVAKDAVFGDDIKLLSDSAVIALGADGDTTLTHTDGTGLTLNSTNKLTFGDAASFIQQSSDGTLRIDGEAIIDLNASTRVDVSGDIKVGGEVQTAGIGYTDGDNAITIADGGGVTFPVSIDITGSAGIILENDETITNSTNGVIAFSGNITVPNAGTIGSAGDTDSIAIASDGVVTMDQIPVFSAGINVSGGTIAGTLATVAQGNITSLGTLTALTVDDVAVNGKVITMTGSSSDTAVFTAGTHGTLSIVTTDDAAAAANIQITADGTAELAGTTVTLDASGDIALDAAADVNIPTDIGLTFGDDGEKIEGDGTDLSIASSGYIRFDADAISFDRAPNADRYLFIEKDFGEADSSKYGMHIRPIASETDSETDKTVTGVLSNPYIGGSGNTATNNQDWSDTAGLRGFDSAPLLGSGASGAMAGVAGFYARNTDKGGSSMTVTKQYGLFVESLTTGDTDYAIYVDGTTLSYYGGPIALGVGSDPSTLANSAHIYAKDDSSSAEVYVRDEAGNVTKISPHNEQGEWEFYTQNTTTGKTFRVNMERMIRKLEEFTGERFIQDEK